MIRAVTFDFWQTLMSERRGHMRELQIARWVDLLAKAGQPRGRAELEDAFAENWRVFEDRWHANGGTWGAAQAVDLVGERMGLEFADGLRDSLIDGFRVVGERAELMPAPGIEDCLLRLRAAGVRLGIVCDVGLTASPTLRFRLDGFGLLEYFDAWAFSDETGWFKPAAEAFEPALQGLGVEPREAAHVGDNGRTDVAGAKALGMVAVQYTGFSGAEGWGSDQAPSSAADHILQDFAALPGIFGL